MSDIKFVRPSYNKKDLDKIKELKTNLPYSSVIIDILYERGYRTEDEIEVFFNGNLNYLNDTSTMKDSDKFVEILKETIENNQKIIDYSDYDVDGVSSAIITVKALRNLGAKVEYYINNRFTGGYGLNKAGIDAILAVHPDTKLIITTDNGIAAHEAVSYAKDKGLKVIVTDHHEPTIDDKGNQILPEADAVIDVKRLDETYPFSGLCGCGVIFKLLLYYYWITGNSLDFMYSLLDIVGLATECDVVPLIDENRILVKEGLKLMRKGTRSAFESLRTKMEVTEIDSYTLGFKYGPAINALGRLDGEASDAVNLFLTDDESEIDRLAQNLVDENKERKKISDEQTKLAIENIDENKLPNVIVSYQEEFHEGVAGIIAGRIKEKFHRPAIVLSSSGYTHPTLGKICKASARSIQGVHMFECLGKLSKYLEKFGGHEMAAGFSIYEKNIPEFTKAFNELIEGTDFTKEIVIDSVLDATEINIDSISELKLLEPFGANFAEPIFGLDNFKVDIENSRYKYMGQNHEHLKLQNKEGLRLITFHGAKKYQALCEPLELKAIGTPQINYYKGMLYPQFVVMNDFIQKK